MIKLKNILLAQPQDYNENTASLDDIIAGKAKICYGEESDALKIIQKMLGISTDGKFWDGTAKAIEKLYNTTYNSYEGLCIGRNTIKKIKTSNISTTTSKKSKYDYLITQHVVDTAKELKSKLALTNIQAAAMAGNLVAESGLVPNRIQGFGGKTGTQRQSGGLGYSYAQWTYWARKRALAKYAKENHGITLDDDMTHTAAIGFLIAELKGPVKYKNKKGETVTYNDFSSMLSGIKKQKTIDNASDYIMVEYLAPKNQSEEKKQKRRDISKLILIQITKPTTTTTTTSPSQLNLTPPDVDIGTDSLDPTRYKY